MYKLSFEDEFKGFDNLLASVYPYYESDIPINFIYYIKEEEEYKPRNRSLKKVENKDKKRKSKKDWKREFKSYDIENKNCIYCNQRFENSYFSKKHIINKECPVIEYEMDNTNSSISEEGDLIYITDNEIELGINDMIIKSQFPSTELRDIMYIAGPHGSGKSTYIKNYFKEFMEVFPDKRVILLSRLLEDDAFKGFDNIIEVDLNDESIITQPLDIKQELNDSLLIFDDYFTLYEKSRKSIEMTLKDAIQNGRDQSGKGEDIYLAITAHQLVNGNKTRFIFTEINSLTFFPKAGDIAAIKHTLRYYFGIDKNLIDTILDLDSRWITITKRLPRYVMWQKGVMLI